MTYLASWIHTPVAQALGWTLLHFVWEGAALAALLAFGLWILRSAASRHRYALACAVLAAMPLVFAATLAVEWSRIPAPPPVVRVAPILPSVADVAPSVPTVLPRFTFAGLLTHLAWIVPLWMAGVLCFYVRAMAGWVAVQRIRRRGVCAPPPAWQQRLEQLAVRLRVSKPVALLESCFTDAPVLIGYWRPVILLPLGCLTGMSTAQVEFILLHELAHVARHDYIVSLLQGVVEGLLFYHPAVWWASHVVRAERENCCDDAVVATMGDARSYAATLAVLEQRRSLTPEAALAATGGSLIKRIRRLTMEPGRAPNSVAPAASAAVLLVLFAAGLLAVPVKVPMPHRAPRVTAISGIAPAVTPQEVPSQADTPYRKWLTEDVAYIITADELAAFSRLHSDSDRENFIELFWNRRDPTPGTLENEFKEEHYRRIAYANEHFAWTQAGWKSDRGRIYITYGPPDEIDAHPSADNVTKFPWQDWHYRHIEGVGENVIVEFIDPSRTGEFRMTMDPSEKQAVLYQQEKGLPLPFRKWLNEDVAYIIRDDERAAFRSLGSDAERERFIEQFWSRRDPTPGTVENEFKEEHYRRIAYANDHFTEGIAGWKTDRGRIYITYGPPDSIADGANGKITWTYRLIDGIGRNVKLDFEAKDGRYYLTMDPQQAAVGLPPGNDAAAKVFAAQGEPAVQVVVGARRRGATGLIQAGDSLDVQFYPAEATGANAELQQALAEKESQLQNLRRKYQENFPDVLAVRAQLQALEDLRDELAASAGKSAAGQVEETKRRENSVRAWILATERSMTDKRQEIAKLEKALTAQQNEGAADPERNKAEIRNKTADLQRVRLLLLEDQRRLALLQSAEASLIDPRQPVNTASPTVLEEKHVVVRPDGKITVGAGGDIVAAGLTPDQLQAALGQQLKGVHINWSRHAASDERPVTVVIPLGRSDGLVDVIGTVTMAGRTVASIRNTLQSQPATAEMLELRPGAYHLKVLVRKQKDGAMSTSSVDFTVD